MACKRRIMAGHIEKVVKRILRRAQHGHIEQKDLPGVIRGRLRSKGYRLQSRITIEKPQKPMNTLRVIFTASRNSIFLPLRIERTHSVPMRGSR